MFDELVESVLPGGAFLAAGVAVGAAFSKQLRPVAKEAIKLGMVAGAALQEAAAEVYERGQDLVAEARYEHEQEQQQAADGTPHEAAPEPTIGRPEPTIGGPGRRPRSARVGRA